jgi:predicted aspartyl protease
MGSATMGKVLVTAKIENLKDLYLAKEKRAKSGRVRWVEVADALVDSGVTSLCLPTRLIHQLGLAKMGTRHIRTTAGISETSAYEAVRLTIQERDCIVDVLEISNDRPVLVGQVPLTILDFVIDPKVQRLIGNPEHGGERMGEQY